MPRPIPHAGQHYAGGALFAYARRMNASAPGLTRAQFKTLALAALGGALEFYDFVIFVFFASTMGALFFPADMPDWLKLVQTFGIFAAGYLARPLGGIVMAHFGDLVGLAAGAERIVAKPRLPTLVGLRAAPERRSLR